MNATLSTRQFRIFALLAVVLVAVGGYVVTRPKSSTTTTPAVTTPAKSTPTQTTPTKPHSRTVTPTQLKTHGLPVAIARALQQHSVVVVSVTDPRGTTDQVDRTEAQAAAATAGAGYVAIDVFHQRAGTAILRKLGVVDTPEILVVKRPSAILSQFKGFVDRAVVSQAVADAR